MRKSKKFASMPVISLEEGQQIGVAKELVVDPAGKRVAALIIDQKGWFREQRFIPYHKISSVGNDAITIEMTSGVERTASFPEIIRLLKEPVEVVGARIVSESGSVLGFVDEYYVDTETGTIAGLEFSGNMLNSVVKGRAFLDINFVRTMGKEVVVVTNEGVENICKLDGGLQETFKNFRDTTSHIWENTVQKTKELTTSLNKTLEKVKKDNKKASPVQDEESLKEEGRQLENKIKEPNPDIPAGVADQTPENEPAPREAAEDKQGLGVTPEENETPADKDTKPAISNILNN